MFPESMRTACEVVTDLSINSTKGLYKFSCNASWIFFTSSMILFAPVLFETERAQMAELEMSQKQRVSIFTGLCNSVNIWRSYLSIIPFCLFIGSSRSWSSNCIKWWCTWNAKFTAHGAINSNNKHTKHIKYAKQTYSN